MPGCPAQSLLNQRSLSEICRHLSELAQSAYAADDRGPKSKMHSNPDLLPVADSGIDSIGSLPHEFNKIVGPFMRPKDAVLAPSFVETH